MKKATRALVSRGCMMALSLCLLIATSAALFMGDSLGWFADNKRIGAEQMHVELQRYGVEATYEAARGSDAFASISAWEDLFARLCPGDTVTLRATYTNTADEDCTLDFSFACPSGGEQPLVLDDTRYYHFSSQLRITSTKVGDNITEPNTFLLAPSDNKLYHTSRQAPTDISLGSSTLAAGASVVVELTIEFCNYPDIDQSVYKEFGIGTDETCIWYLRALIS